MHLEYQKLLKEHPDLAGRLNALPGRVFSGKAHPSPAARAVFFCYALPAPSAQDRDGERENEQVWTEDAGYVQWYLFNLANEVIISEPTEIIDLIRSTPETPRKHDLLEPTLSEIRAKVEKQIKNTYLRQVQAPIGVHPILKAWLELS